MGKRKAYTPFSTSSEAGISAAPVEGYIQVEQEVRPTIDTGFIDSQGTWIGHTTSDSSFTIRQTDIGIPNGGEILTPSANADNSWPLDMTGYNDLFLAIKPTNGGAYALEAVMGPDTTPFANLSPVNAAGVLRGVVDTFGNHALANLFVDVADTLVVDVWNIFYIGNNLKNQKLLQFKITNNSGGSSDIETAFMRMV